MSSPPHWAMTVPAATPAMSIRKPSTSVRLVTMLMMFCEMETTIGRRVFCIPTNHPVSPYRLSMAGAPHIQMLQ